MKKINLVSLAIASSLSLAACNPSNSNAPRKITQSQKAQQAAESINFTANAEIDNIKRRLELTSQPGLLGFIAVTNLAGSPILYTSVEGKVTSGGKRLTPQTQRWRIDRGEFRGTTLGPSPSDEGTWGSSNKYVYWWNQVGQYFQTNQLYIYSDQPFRLNAEPLIAINDATREAERLVNSGQKTTGKAPVEKNVPVNAPGSNQ